MIIAVFLFAFLVLSNSNMSRALEEGIKQHEDKALRKRSLNSKLCEGQRFALNVAATMNEPFKSVVRITLQNNGRCSGVLIGPRHVLTSAHCVHNRTALTSPLASLKVGIVQDSRTRRILTTHYVEDVFVADRYLRGTQNSAKNDYAVLKLKLPHGRSYLNMEAMSDGDLKALPHHTVHFASFPINKPPKQMWYTSCSNLKPKANVLWSRCVAKSGSSGSGVYVLKPRNRRVVIGVLSGVRRNQCTTVTTRLTASKIQEICTWIGRGRNCPQN